MRKFWARSVALGLSAAATFPMLETCVVRIPDIRDVFFVGDDDDDLEDLFDDDDDFFDELEDLFD